MDKSNKNPDIRFKGFKEDWAIEKLEKLANFSKGQGYSKGDLLETGTPIILYGRLYTKYQAIINEVDTFVLPKEGSIYSNGNEVLVPASGETPEDIARASAVLKKGILLGGDLNIIIPDDSINSVFLALNISNGRIKKDLAKRAQGKSVVHLRNDDLKEVSLNYPNILEQNSITSFFQNLDNLISLHKKKHNKLLVLKKAMLVKMFPKNNISVPEIRFKGFSGDWKDTDFNKTSWFQEGPGLRHWQFTEQGIKVINVTNLVDGVLNLEKTRRHISYSEFDKIYKHFEIQANDIVIASSGNSYGKVSIVRECDLPLLMNTSVIRFKPLLNLDFNYLLIFLKSSMFKNQIDLLITGGAQPNFGPVHINKLKINLPPTIEEQQKIGEYFKNLDNQIVLHKTQIDKLNNIKKACFSKMFVAQD